MSDNVKTSVETFLKVHKISDGLPELPDLSDNQLVARATVTFDFTDRKGTTGAAYASTLEMYKAMGEALKERIPVDWTPGAYGSIGTLRAFIFTPGELRSVIEAAYRMGADGRPFRQWDLNSKLGIP